MGAFEDEEVAEGCEEREIVVDHGRDDTERGERGVTGGAGEVQATKDGEEVEDGETVGGHGLEGGALRRERSSESV